MHPDVRRRRLSTSGPLKGFTMRSTRFSSAASGGSSRHHVDPHGSTRRPRARRAWRAAAIVTGAPLLSVGLLGPAFTGPAAAAGTVELGTATPFAVLAATAVTNVPTSSLTGDVGLSPAAGTNYAGLTQAEVSGTIYSTDGTGPAGTVSNPALLTTAQNDLTTAYVAAAGQTPTSTFNGGDNQLGGQTLTAGVYAFGHASTANITAASPLVLNGQGDANAVFVFQASSDLVTASDSVVQLENGAQACNVFWQVSSSATLSSASTFVGTIMALTSATLDSGATVQGRVLARNGAVTLDANTITAPPACATTAATPPTTTPATTTPPTTTPATATTVTTTPAATAGTTTSTGSNSTTVDTLAAQSASGTGSTTGATGVSAVIPVGAPRTGLGGASHSRGDALLGSGAILIGVAGAVTVVGLRRRRATRAGAMATSR